jgi:hypothetical protein
MQAGPSHRPTLFSLILNEKRLSLCFAARRTRQCVYVARFCLPDFPKLGGDETRVAV